MKRNNSVGINNRGNGCGKLCKKLAGSMLVFVMLAVYFSSLVGANAAAALPVYLSKTAAPVAGTTDTWQVTLNVSGETQTLTKTADVVLVYDTSGSMAFDDNGNTASAGKSRLDSVKSASTTLLNTIFNQYTRVAMVSFSEAVNSNTNFYTYDQKATLLSSINSLSASGGTNLQAGVYAARLKLASSTATNKYIIVLTDGQPTFSFKATSTTSYTGWTSTTGITKHSFKITAFDYTNTKGSGSSYTLDQYAQSSSERPYTVGGYTIADNGIGAISEASLAKTLGDEIYTIGCNVSTDNNVQYVLTNVSTDTNHAQNTNIAGIPTAFANVAGYIKSIFPATDGTITDPIGDKFEIVDGSISASASTTASYNSTTKTITWTTPAITDGPASSNKAILTYKVKIKSDAETGVSYPTNGTTRFSYTDSNKSVATKDFVVPTASICKTPVTYLEYGNETNVLATDSISAYLGASYTIPSKSFSGYTYKSTTDPNSGTSVSSAGTIKVYYTADMQTLKLESNGADGGSMANSVKGTDVAYNLPKNSYTKTGYTFMGWAETSGGTVAYADEASFEMPVGGDTLYAIWKINSYDVSYNSNNAIKGTVPTTASISYNNSVSVLGNTGNLIRDGYSFTGWNTANDGSGTSYQAGGTFNMPASAVTLYAIWSAENRTLVYNANGGSGSMDNTVKATDTTFALSANTYTKAGYTFSGWSTTAGGAVAYADKASYKMPANGATLYAVWTAAEQTITFTGTGCTGSTAAVKGNTDSKITLPANGYSKDGYTFGGWSTTNGGAKVYDDKAEITVPAGGLNLYPVWVAANQTLVYNANGGTETMANSVQATDTTFKLTKNAFKKVGYTFSGWSTTAGGAVAYADEADYKMSANGATLYVVWTVNKYNVSFISDGKAVGTKDADYGTKVTLPTPTKDGYTLAGWDKDGDGKADYVGGAEFTIPSGDTTLTAVWTAANQTLVYNANGGTETMANSVQATDSTFKLTKNAFKKVGYTFSGWSTTAGGAVAYADEADYKMPANGATLYAVWTAAEQTITFTGTGCTGSTAEVKGDTGSEVTLTANGFSKAGYTFGGWDKNGDGKADYSNSEKVTVPANGMTLTSIWTINNYTVTFKDGTTTVDTKTANYDTAVVLLTAPTKTGYVFSGWNTAEDGKAFDASTKVTANITVYAQWKLASYNVTFMSDGAQSSNVTADYNTKVTVPTLTKTGYTFGGWDINGDGKADYAGGAEFTIPAGDTTLTAVWTELHTVSYDANGGSGSVPATKSYAASATVTVDFSTLPTKDGYTFAGWNDGKTTYTKAGTKSFEMGKANVVLTAVWTLNKYNVTFMSDGKESSKITVDYNTTEKLPAPTKDGYTLAGWDRDGDGKADYVGGAEFTIPAGDTTLTAVWTELYTVSYDANGGSGSVPATKSFAESATVAVDFDTLPTKEGYTFAGWNDGKTTFTKAGTKSFAMGKANVVLTAVWTLNNYTVTFMADGKPVGTATADYKNTLNHLPTNPTKTGYVFTGWKTAEDETGTAFDASTKVTANITVYAQWSKAAQTYTVTFMDGSTEVSKVSVPENGKITPPVPKKTGYVFDSWNTSEDGNGTKFTNGTEVKADTTVYAQWKSAAYTVTFMDGSTEKARVSAASNGTAILPEAPTKSGYVFTGWKTAEDGNGTAFDASTKVTANITVYAQWSKAAETYTVTFMDGSTEVSRVSVAENGKITAPTPTKEGYILTGWYTAENGKGSQLTDSFELKTNITFYAQWTLAEEKTCTVNYSANGGLGSVPVDKTKYTSGSSVTVLFTPVPFREGYTFAGWSLKSGAFSVDFATDGVNNIAAITDDVTLYAVWTAVIKNNAPEAIADKVNILQNTELTGTVSGYDKDKDALTFTIKEGPKNGEIVLNADGTYKYTPNEKYTGTDSFTFTCTDGKDKSNTATVDIVIILADAAPIAKSDKFEAAVGVPLEINISELLANDEDPNNDTLIITDVGKATYGTISYDSGSGKINYIPPAGYFEGNDVFIYTITDGKETSTANVIVSVKAKFQISITPEPASIVGNGTSKTLLTAKVTDSAGNGVPGVEVKFATSDYNTDDSFKDLERKVSRTAVTDKDGVAKIYYYSTNLESATKEPSIFKPISFDVTASADDDAKYLHAKKSFQISFVPGILKGVMYDSSTNSKLANTEITVSLDNGDKKWSETIKTNAKGEYSTYVPWSGETYTVSIVKSVTVTNSKGEKTTTDITFSQKGTTDASQVGTGGTFDSKKTISGLVMQQDETTSEKKLIDSKELSKYKVAIYKGTDIASGQTPDATPTLTENGQYTAEDLGVGTYTVAITYKTDEGKTLIAANRTVTIDDEGQMTISAVLIDPYGIITDKSTGAVINKVDVTLYYADTARNKANGITPNTVVVLPVIAGFAPNNNVNPDTDANGDYAFMVFPTTDYYVVAKAAGYDTYTSPTLSVEYTILKHDIQMTKTALAGGGGAGGGASSSSSDESADLALAIQSSSMKLSEDSTVDMTITYANKTDVAVGDAYVEVQIPTSMSLVSANNSGAASGSSIKWSLGKLDSGASGKLTFTLKANTISSAEEFATVTATIGSKTTKLINAEDDTSFIKVLIFSNKFEHKHMRYIKGYPDGEVKPDNSITRAEVAAIFARLSNLQGTVTHETVYTDVEQGFWATDYIEAVSKQGIFKGYTDGSFKPNQPITRAELATAIARYLGVAREMNLVSYINLSGFKDTKDTWAAQTIEELFRFRVISGYSDGSFKPYQNITRAETITMINRMLYRGPLTNVDSSFKDNGNGQWYFGQIEEATRTHYYTINSDSTEKMTKYVEEALW